LIYFLNFIHSFNPKSFINRFFEFLIDTNDKKILENINSIFNSKNEYLKNIEIKTNNLIDLNILKCACFEEIVNHITLIDDNIHNIVID
jgi:hypothetical protein